MLNLERMIRAGAASAGTDMIVAAPFDLGDRLCRDFVREGLVRGYVANAAPRTATGEPSVAGWWIDRDEGRWFLGRQSASTLLFLGSEQQVRLRMLIEAKRSGIRRMLLVGAEGAVRSEINVGAALIDRFKAAVVRKVL